MNVKTKDELIKQLHHAAGRMQAVTAAAKLSRIVLETEPQAVSPGVGGSLTPGNLPQGKPKG